MEEKYIKFYMMFDRRFKNIADKLNSLGIKTHRGKSFSSGSIHSILKRKKERDKWIEEVRNKEFPFQILNFGLR